MRSRRAGVADEPADTAFHLRYVVGGSGPRRLGLHQAIKPEAAQLAVEVNWRNAAERLRRVIDSVGERSTW